MNPFGLVVSRILTGKQTNKPTSEINIYKTASNWISITYRYQYEVFEYFEIILGSQFPFNCYKQVNFWILLIGGDIGL